MIHLSLFCRAGWGRFSGLVGGAYGRCLTATNDTTPLLDFSYTSQSAADLGAAAHGPIKKWDRLSGFRATPRATASWAGLRDRYAQRGLSPVVRFGACSYAICMRSSHAICAAATLCLATRLVSPGEHEAGGGGEGEAQAQAPGRPGGGRSALRSMRRCRAWYIARVPVCSACQLLRVPS